MLKHGQDAVNEVNQIYQFEVQMNNSRKFHIDKSKDEINKDYFVFSLDLKNDNGLVYVGTCQEYFGRQETGFKGSHKADVIIGLREKEVINVLT